MSATTGIGDSRTISCSAAAASRVSQVTRMTSAPAFAARWIWAMVAAASSVWVLVIVCTAIGAAPPMTTVPTRTGTVGRRALIGEPPSLIASHVSDGDIHGKDHDHGQTNSGDRGLDLRVQAAAAHRFDEDEQ